MPNQLAFIPDGKLIHSMSDADINLAIELEQDILTLPQTSIPTEHSIHSGVYTRTVMIPQGVVIGGALVKRSTTLILSGHAIVIIGDEETEYNGYAVLCASANRKQAFYAIADTCLTMLFSTTATTVEEAEEEFTDEADRLMSRHPHSINIITNTGE